MRLEKIDQLILIILRNDSCLFICICLTADKYGMKRFETLKSRSSESTRFNPHQFAYHISFVIRQLL